MSIATRRGILCRSAWSIKSLRLFIGETLRLIEDAISMHALGPSEDEISMHVCAACVLLRVLSLDDDYTVDKTPDTAFPANPNWVCGHDFS